MRKFIFAFAITVVTGFAVISILSTADMPLAGTTTNGPLELDMVPASGPETPDILPFNEAPSATL